MLKKFLSVFICVIYFFHLSNLCYAFFGKSGWPIFRKVSSAKFKAMTTTTGVRGDLSGVFYNPAVLGTNQQRELFFISELGFTEDKFGGLVYGEPLKNGMLAGGIVYYDAGKMKLNWFEGDELKTDNVFAQRDLLGILSYGHKFKYNMYSGASIKFAKSKIVERESAVAYVGDFGIFYLPVGNLSLSAAVQNLGTSTKFIDKKNPLPSSGYIGSGYFCDMRNYYLLPGVGATYNLEDEELIPELGFEFGYNFLSINVGYRFNVEEAKLHFGLGLNSKNVDFGYAFIPGLYLDTTHRISIGYRIGTPVTVDTAVSESKRPQKQTNYIQVNVTDTKGNPLPNTTIKILQEENVIAEELTDGEYISENLPYGKYTVKAWKPGYISQEKEVEVISGSPSELKFTLKKR